MKANILASFAFLVGSAFANADTCPVSGRSFEPTVSSKVTYNKKANLYTYEYSISNSARSLVPIDSFFVGIGENPAAVVGPKDWDANFREASQAKPAHLVWSTWWSTAKPDPKIRPESQITMPDQAIRAGKSLSGFKFTSPNPPGLIQYYIDGFQKIPIAVATSESPDPDLECPNQDENPHFRRIITGMTTGPINPNTIPVKIRARKKSGGKFGSFDPQNPQGQIKILVLGRKDFDVDQIDISTLRFGPDEALPLEAAANSTEENLDAADENEEWERNWASIHGKHRPENRHLVLTFDVAPLGVQCLLDTSIFLRGRTLDGKSVIGAMSTKAVGCDIKHPGKRRLKRKH